jgi:hypothetical protein
MACAFIAARRVILENVSRIDVQGGNTCATSIATSWGGPMVNGHSPTKKERPEHQAALG